MPQERFRIHRPRYVIALGGWQCHGCGRHFPDTIPAAVCTVCSSNMEAGRKVKRCSRCWKRHEEHMFEVDRYPDEPSAFSSREQPAPPARPTLAAQGARRGRPVSPQKAREILQHGEVRGHRLTPRQRRFFGAIASGQPLRRRRR